ncbi:MAG: hypothetical protein GX640_13295, partial [Fibrobacter sp.]|nr:hypothetical protein [Fibrobacter sp.]
MMKKILISLEFLIFAAIWGLILLKYPIPLASSHLFIKVGPVLLLITLITIYSILKIQYINFKISYADAFGLSVLAISSEYFQYSNFSQFTAPFFVVMTTAGILGKRMYWIIPFSVFIISYCFFNIYNQDSLVLDYQIIYPLLGLALSGLLPSLLQNRSTQITKTNITEKKEVTSINQQPQQHSTEQQVNPFSAHTQQFTAEFIAELK